MCKMRRITASLATVQTRASLHVHYITAAAAYPKLLLQHKGSAASMTTTHSPRISRTSAHMPLFKTFCNGPWPCSESQRFDGSATSATSSLATIPRFVCMQFVHLHRTAGGSVEGAKVTNHPCSVLIGTCTISTGSTSESWPDLACYVTLEV